MNRDHPLWLVGFRPFFALACLAGASLPVLWLLLYSGAVAPPLTFAAAPLVWHAHEMIYGFAWAMLGGFLLTASKNWVGIRGYHGGTLILLSAAWLLDRLAMLYGGAWPAALFWLAGSLFIAGIVALLLATMIRYRASDSYRDNLYFILALPLFLPAKWLLLSADHFAAGRSMSLALFRLAFLIMLERTLSQFMKSVFQLSLPRSAAVDHGIKGLALALVAAPLLPAGAVAAANALLAALLLVRWLRWHGLRALSRIELGIMYLGYLAIVAQLLLDALAYLLPLPWVGSLAVHVFTLGTLGAITPAMIVRIAKGHTGRKVVFDALDKGVLWLMLAGALIRLALPQFLPAAYPVCLWLSALCWLLGFGLLGARYIPWLWQPRADGRQH